jgi:aminoglycoside 2'-N-acetyltransferase I
VTRVAPAPQGRRPAGDRLTDVAVRPREEGWQEVRPLAALVYPPAVLATIVWRDVKWAEADYWVLVRDRDRRLLSAVGMYLRNGRHDEAAVRLGGIGGVMTHPDHRGRGHASAALRHADALFREHGVDFGLLVCEAKCVAFYGRLDWRVFPGAVIVEQPRWRGPFMIMSALVKAVNQPAPTRGTIDLCGLPW